MKTVKRRAMNLKCWRQRTEETPTETDKDRHFCTFIRSRYMQHRRRGNRIPAWLCYFWLRQTTIFDFANIFWRRSRPFQSDAIVVHRLACLSSSFSLGCSSVLCHTVTYPIAGIFRTDSDGHENMLHFWITIPCTLFCHSLIFPWGVFHNNFFLYKKYVLWNVYRPNACSC